MADTWTAETCNMYSENVCNSVDGNHNFLRSILKFREEENCFSCLFSHDHHLTKSSLIKVMT